VPHYLQSAVLLLGLGANHPLRPNFKLEYSMFACPSFDCLIHFSYSSWSGNQDYTIPNASKISFLCLISRISLFNLEMNWPDIVAEGCTHFPQLFVWERKEKPEVEETKEHENEN